MPLILNIETGTDVCSVALSKNGRLISLRESAEGKQHAQNLGVYIDEIFAENDIDLSDLDAVAVGMGPGSYTGLRIGVSMAKGICYGLNIPMIAVNSLKAIASVALEDYRAGIVDIEDISSVYLCPMIDARRMEVYSQIFDSNLTACSDVEATVIEPDSFSEFLQKREMVIFGSGAEKCVEIIANPNLRLIDVSPSARGIVALSHKAFQDGDFVDIAYFEPLYLKDFIVTQSKKKLF